MSFTELSTSLRDAQLKSTRERARALMPELGISACDDVTASDILGVPIWFSRRPAGLSASVHAGKGLHPLEAEVGALMEAIELAVIERADAAAPEGGAGLGDLLRSFDGDLTLADLAPCLDARLGASTVVPYDSCEDIVSGHRHRMPSELLRLLPVPGAPPGTTGADQVLFGPSANGLASGNSLDEATLHGLLEVLERDCIALDMARPLGERLLPDSLPPPFADWHDRWRGQGLRLSLRFLRNAFGLACIQAEIASEPPARPTRYRGCGFHPVARIALTRAVTEAAQSRLHSLTFASADEQRIAMQAPELQVVAQRRFDEVPDLQAPTIAALLDTVCERLRRQGLRHVLRRRVHHPALERASFHVVKMLVPGCETPVGRRPRIGRRLAQRIAGPS